MDYTIGFLSAEWMITVLTSLAFILFILYMGKISNQENKIKFIKIIALIMIFFTITNHVIHLYDGTWSEVDQLPIHLCGISALICCFIVFIPENKRQFLFEFLFYCGIIGGTVSILTPLIDNTEKDWFTIIERDEGSVNFFYIQFFVKHAIILAFPLYLRNVMNMELKTYSWLRTFIALNVLLAIIMPINHFLGSNYMYLAEAPAVDNPLILTREWPWYVLTWEPIILILILIVYYFSKPKKV